MEYATKETQFGRSNPAIRTNSTSLNNSALSQDQFHRDIYLPPASYNNNNIEKRMRDEEKGTNDEKDDNTKEKEKENIPKLIRHFLGYTTAHGIGRLADNISIFWKIFWSIVCMGAFGMFVYQAYGLFQIYFSRPVSTTVRITFEKQVSFPAVTICNLNMMRASFIPQVVQKQISKTYDAYNVSKDAGKSRTRRDLLRTTRKPVNTLAPYRQATSASARTYYGISTGYKSRTTSYPRYSGKYNYYYGGGYYGQSHYKYYDNELLPAKEELDEQTRFAQSFATVVTHVPEEQLREAGHQFDDLVAECSWRGLECKKSNYSNWWYQSWNYKYGNCFTFNGGIDKNGKPIRVLSTSKPGPTQGLLLRLNIEQDKYIKTISSEAGVRVILHDQGVKPFPFQEGFSVSPKMSTSVGIQITVISRVDRFSNNTCWDIDELDKDNIYRIHENITKYTQQTCQNSCLGKTQFDECGCSEYLFPSSKPACDTFNDTIRICLQNVYHRFNNDAVPCLEECRQRCSENVIQKTISMSQWPSAEYENFQKLKDKTFSAKDNVMLNVFYNELNYQRIEERFIYDEINLLADLGGQLGLWIGVSVITCCETLELLMLIAAHLLRKFRAKDHVNNVAIP